MSTSITREQLEIDRRVSHTARLFGLQFPLRFEPYVYAVTSRLGPNTTAATGSSTH